MADCNLNAPNHNNDVPQSPSHLARACWISNRVVDIVALAGTYCPIGDDPDTSEMVRLIGLAKAELMKCHAAFYAAWDGEVTPMLADNERMDALGSDTEARLIAAVSCVKVVESLDWGGSDDLDADAEYLLDVTVRALNLALDKLYSAASDIRNGTARNETTAH